MAHFDVKGNPIYAKMIGKRKVSISLLILGVGKGPSKGMEKSL